MPDKTATDDIAKNLWPNNCALIERTGDGVRVGRCWFPLKNGRCPRHGTKTSGVEAPRKDPK